MNRTLDELMGEYEVERLAEIEQAEARRNAPAERARLEAKRKEEFERGVRNGWWDADGNPIAQPGDDEINDSEEEDDQ
jgi:hypothetical protein